MHNANLLLLTFAFKITFISIPLCLFLPPSLLSPLPPYLIPSFPPSLLSSLPPSLLKSYPLYVPLPLPVSPCILSLFNFFPLLLHLFCPILFTTCMEKEFYCPIHSPLPLPSASTSLIFFFSSLLVCYFYEIKRSLIIPPGHLVEIGPP